MLFKKELIRTKARKQKKRALKRIFIKQVNNLNFTMFNLFMYFLRKQHIFINKKVYSALLICENGSVNSLQNWFKLFYKKIY